MRTKPPLTRRQFLISAAVAAGGLGLAACGPAIESIAEQPAADVPTSTASATSTTLAAQASPATATLSPKATALPNTAIATNTPEPVPTAVPTAIPVAPAATMPAGDGRVVHIHSEQATSWNGQANYWESINQAQVTEMLSAGLLSLTNTATLADAWRAILPGYASGQKIAIKVNFNNMPDNAACDATTPAIDAVIEPVNAIIAGLVTMGVAESDIGVYDAMRRIPDRFVNPCSYADVQFFDKYGSCPRREIAGWGGEPVQFSAGISSTQYIANPLVNAAYLINVPILKAHSCQGVTLGFKNHYGTIDNPGGLHPYSFVNDQCGVEYQYTSERNPLIDIMRHPHVGPKTVLTVGDGLLGCREGENRPPSPWASFGYQAPNSLFLSRDPVAIDCVMHDFLRYEHEIEWITFLPEAGRYLALAAAAGLGICEHVDDPHTQAYAAIQYIYQNL